MVVRGGARMFARRGSGRWSRLADIHAWARSTGRKLMRRTCAVMSLLGEALGLVRDRAEQDVDDDIDESADEQAVVRMRPGPGPPTQIDCRVQGGDVAAMKTNRVLVEVRTRGGAPALDA